MTLLVATAMIMTVGVSCHSSGSVQISRPIQYRLPTETTTARDVSSNILAERSPGATTVVESKLLSTPAMITATVTPGVAMPTENVVLGSAVSPEVQPITSTPQPPIIVEHDDPGVPRPIQVQNVYATLAHHTLGVYADMLVDVANDYAIDYRILPAISIWESSGGDQACGYNAWGYASCAQTFSSWEEGARMCADLLVRLGARENVEYALRVWVAGAGGAYSDHATSYATRVMNTINSMEK